MEGVAIMSCFTLHMQRRSECLKEIREVVLEKYIAKAGDSQNDNIITSRKY